MQNGVACGDLNLNLFARIECIRWIHTDLMQRQVKAERMYSLYLLIKKVLLFLVSTQSKMAQTMVHPQSLESYILVENRCFEYSVLKKRESYNRSMGSHRSTVIYKQQLFRQLTFLIKVCQRVSCSSFVNQH